MTELGKIEKVFLREIWPHETFNFTAWLARDENMRQLSEEIGIEMRALNTEASVGAFSADILAVDVRTGYKIVIENQLEPTNHDHLGKLITYAAGLNARHIIWICREVREEHASAINWLNEITADGINFFVVRMEVWRIDDSLPAPKFSLVCAPRRCASTPLREGCSDDLKLLQLHIWDDLAAWLDDHNRILAYIRKGMENGDI